jgi:hypothetical protein
MQMASVAFGSRMDEDSGVVSEQPRAPVSEPVLLSERWRTSEGLPHQLFRAVDVLS